MEKVALPERTSPLAACSPPLELHDLPREAQQLASPRELSACGSATRIHNEAREREKWNACWGPAAPGSAEQGTWGGLSGWKGSSVPVGGAVRNLRRTPARTRSPFRAR